MGGIGETLRVVRKQRGLTQKDLAQTMAVSQSSRNWTYDTKPHVYQIVLLTVFD